ncbi:glycosyltransferase family 2 protein [Phreatobacter sp.]|uniref:glycosyltransferase family 2 protein n=1 Tax=Phreatobacter sp. TaxID=1966341 RepID=UPI003F70FBBC
MTLSPTGTGEDHSQPGPDRQGETGVRAVVVVPTFRRPAMLADTLASLEAQETSVSFAVVVLENDAAGREGLAVARRVFAARRLTGLAAVEPRQGNVHAINAGFALALERFPAADFFLMIDDDEVATPGWLDLMVKAAEAQDADIVGGPVQPRFHPGAGSQFRRHPVFWPSIDRTGPVAMIYGTGNCLLRRRVFARVGLPALDERFNFLGGGDLDLFDRCRRAGLGFYWVQEALIVETVPPERTRVGWVLRRGMRIGTINRAVERKNAAGMAGRLRILAKDLAIVPAALMRALAVLVRTGNPLAAAHPLAVSAGRLTSALGFEPQPYKAKA